MTRNRDPRRRSLACVALAGIIIMFLSMLIWKEWCSELVWVIAALAGLCMVMKPSHQGHWSTSTQADQT
jgi:hypothetical protein